MMKALTRWALAGGTAWLLAMGTAQAADFDAAALSETCAGCHGTDGSSLGAAPTIANLTQDYFIQAMKDYAAGTRPSTVMGRIAKGYSEDEIKAMAAWFDPKPFGRTAQTVDPALAAKGKDLQAKFCENCHEKGGALSDGIGVLAGQRLAYMEYAIADFQGGKRPVERRKQQKMDDLMAAAGADGFKAVLHYYASQK